MLKGFCVICRSLALKWFCLIVYRSGLGTVADYLAKPRTELWCVLLPATDSSRNKSGEQRAFRTNHRSPHRQRLRGVAWFWRGHWFADGTRPSTLATI